ncbi:LOW QUALITY PROTEIN: hypothetical protein ACHAXR_000998, partial [Thalassiosira sp. AJA248-18]
MLERAKDCPYRQAVLIELRYAEIPKLMRMSAKIGRRGSVELFLASVRFAVPLWATTHAVDYVRLGADLLTFVYCAPPAVRVLYENEVFTRLTATGKAQPSDQAMEMEKSVKHDRRHMGKVDQGRVMEKKMEHVCNEIPNRAPGENVRRELREGSSTIYRSTGDEWLKENSPLIQGFRLIHHKIQLWHHTNQPIIGRGADRAPIFSKLNSYELPKKETLNPQVLICNKIGTKLAIDYLK